VSLEKNLARCTRGRSLPNGRPIDFSRPEASTLRPQNPYHPDHSQTPNSLPNPTRSACPN